MTKKRITIVTPCYNEEGNVELLVEKIMEVMSKVSDRYTYEHLFMDNSSTDQTVAILRRLASKFSHIRVIVNTRNFGHIRSPYYGMLQAQGDIVISVVADLQDPPEMILEFLKKWEEGFKIAIGIKSESQESPIFFAIRKMYYNLVSRLSHTKLIKNFTGFGLYDKLVIETLRKIDDPYPYFRGLISDLGWDIAQIPYVQPVRKRGFTKNNFYTLYDIGMLGITNYSKIPLRMATMAGFVMAALSLLVALGYFIAKLIFWSNFTIGTAPVIIGVFFFSSVQLFFIGVLGEYIGAIHTQVQKRPLVIEKERIGFPPA